jgi:DDE family transposase
MTECTKSAADVQLRFDFGLGKPIAGSFDGGEISSDGGLVLVRQIDDKLQLSKQIAFCLADRRNFSYVKHALEDLIRQRLYAIAAGNEDVNDAQTLRHDPMHKLAVGSNTELASQPTLSRFENSVSEPEIKSLQELLIQSYVQQFKRAPERVVLDMDTTCDEVHGYQQMSFWNGFYATYCYVPLFIFAENGHPLAALLRSGKDGPATGAIESVGSVVSALRSSWPGVRVQLRADAGFCTPGLFTWCEQNGVEYYIGARTNNVLLTKTRDLVQRAKGLFSAMYGDPGVPAYSKARKKHVLKLWKEREMRIRFSSKEEGRMQEHFEDEEERRVRLVEEFAYKAENWPKERRVIARVDYTPKGEEVRYIVTNAVGSRPAWIYEDKYCKRAQCENWIKELKVDLNADRLSCQEFKANQFRLLMHVFSYILLLGLRERLGRSVQRITIGRLRNNLVKIGVLVRQTARRVCLHWSSTHPWQAQFMALAACLQS